MKNGQKWSNLTVFACFSWNVGKLLGIGMDFRERGT